MVAILFYLLKLNNLPLSVVGIRGSLSLEGVLYASGGRDYLSGVRFNSSFARS